MKLNFRYLVKDIVHCSILLRCLMALYISVVQKSISKMLLTLYWSLLISVKSYKLHAKYLPY